MCKTGWSIFSWADKFCAIPFIIYLSISRECYTWVNESFGLEKPIFRYLNYFSISTNIGDMAICHSGGKAANRADFPLFWLLWAPHQSWLLNMDDLIAPWGSFFNKSDCSPLTTGRLVVFQMLPLFWNVVFWSGFLYKMVNINHIFAYMARTSILTKLDT